MADSQNINDDIIELTELIEKGDTAAPADSETVSEAALKAQEDATGTALESLNDASTTSPEGDIDSLLAQMDAGDKNETMAQPTSQTEISTETLTADATGHLVDPHEKLDMSGMAKVDNLLSSLQIPLTPPAGDSSRSNADAAPQHAAPPPLANIPFDIDSLLNPVANVSAFLEDTNPQAEEEPEVERPAPSSDSVSGPGESAAGAQPPEKTQTEVHDLSAELDDILAAAGNPDLSEDPTPQRPPEQEETPSVAVEEHSASQPPTETPADNAPARTQEDLPVTELASLDEKSFRDEESFSSDDSPPSADEAAAEHTLPLEKSPAPSQVPAEAIPEVIQDAEQCATETVVQEAAVIETPPEETREPSSLLADRLQEIENRLAALEKGLREIEAQESSSFLADRLQEVENRLLAQEKNLTEIAGASSLEDFEQRLASLESATIPIKEESPALVKENAQALHAYMELAARMDGIETRLSAIAEFAARVDNMETRLNAIAELATRVDDMETRLNGITEQFETRVEKAAAAAAAKLLREEIARLLAS
ncbi:MAG: hypothetical protein LBR94_10145 [Desulfovibrio sp.]|jgi:hypothetical protein|nr:hypothetical protein [Desulfovibrio sp.]